MAEVRDRGQVVKEKEEGALGVHIQNHPLVDQELQVVALARASTLQFAHRMRYHPLLMVA